MHTMAKVGAALLALGVSGSAQAMLAYVDDAVLDSMRGRYVDGSQLVRFGVQMMTTWQSAAGTAYGSALQMTGQAGAVPVINRYVLNPATTTTTASKGLPAGLGSVQGVVQLNQQAGNGNQSSNSTTIAINSPSGLPGLPAGWQASGGSTPLNQAALAVSINMGSAGSVGQSLGQGQLLQYSQIAGSGVVSSNSLQIQLWLQTPAANQSFVFPSRIMLGGLGLH